MRLLTFNAGLAVGVIPHTTERVPHVAAALASFDADLVFLQEVWLDPHWDAIVAQTDHVLFRGFDDAALDAERVLDGALDIDAGDRRVTTTYSDHSGVAATLSFRARSAG